jgi:hypothetical protein
MLILAIVLGLSSGIPDRLRSGLTIVAAFVGLFALVSPLAVGAIYGPSLSRAARQSGYVAAQPYSMSVFGHARLRPQILAAAKLCGIEDLAKARAMLIDDVTYLPFVRSTLPQHKLGVIGVWHGKISDPVAYLKSRGSDGAVITCTLLPRDLRGRARAVGKFCCLGPPNW